MAPPRAGQKRKRVLDVPELTPCAVCGELRHPRRLSAHQQVCREYQRRRAVLEKDARSIQIPRRGKKRKLDDKMPRLRLRKAPGNKENIPPPDNYLDQPQDISMADSEPPEPAGPPQPAPDLAPPTVHLPPVFLLTVPHPHAHLPSTIIPLDNPPPSTTSRVLARGFNFEKPYAPFRCYADYHFTSKCVRFAKSDKEIQEDLDSQHNNVYNDGAFKHMADSLRATRQLTVEVRSLVYRLMRTVPDSVTVFQFKRARVTVDFEADAETDRFRGVFEVEIDFRDPWEVVQSWVRDETLVPYSTWFSVRKYYCRGGARLEYQEEVLDEPWTGSTWRKIDDNLPDWDLASPESNKQKYPSCYLPLHIWLDKGQVSTKVKKHPILLRGLWIDSAVRNGAGNGGSALLGYVVLPPEIRNVDYHSLSGREQEDLAKLKGRVYNEINSVILRSLMARSVYGDTFRFVLEYGVAVRAVPSSTCLGAA
ncbi:hypothetical protein GGX14DRAFT_404564 [Mycena pura]|uniref:Uncharacterized protein n=1 Tax=Mycena pura TaxID=153505 RepID=A0AAD6XZY2_9AGAR|nr:hypothetical protein GGX14DRAFT_404564 [Mycena pura]